MRSPVATHEESPRRLSRRHAWMLLASGLLFVVALAVAGVTSVFFVRDLITGGTFPLAMMNGGESQTVALPDRETRYAVMVAIDGRDGETPSHAIEVRDAATGSVLPIEEQSLLATIFGRFYRIVAVVEAPASLEIVVTTEADQREDFEVLREPRDAFDHEVSRAGPGWLIAAGVFTAAVVLLCAAIASRVRTQDEMGLGSV